MIARTIGRLVMELLVARATAAKLRIELAQVKRARDLAESSTWKLVERIEQERRRADLAEQSGTVLS